MRLAKKYKHVFFHNAFYIHTVSASYSLMIGFLWYFWLRKYTYHTMYGFQKCVWVKKWEGVRETGDIYLGGLYVISTYKLYKVHIKISNFIFWSKNFFQCFFYFCNFLSFFRHFLPDFFTRYIRQNIGRSRLISCAWSSWFQWRLWR